jgi:hypothetical protein
VRFAQPDQPDVRLAHRNTATPAPQPEPGIFSTFLVVGAPHRVHAGRPRVLWKAPITLIFQTVRTAFSNPSMAPSKCLARKVAAVEPNRYSIVNNRRTIALRNRRPRKGTNDRSAQQIARGDEHGAQFGRTL